MGVLGFTWQDVNLQCRCIFDEVNKYRTSRNVSKDAMKLMFGLA